MDLTLNSDHVGPDIMLDISTTDNLGFAEVFEHLSQASQMILEEIAGNLIFSSSLLFLIIISLSTGI